MFQIYICSSEEWDVQSIRNDRHPYSPNIQLLLYPPVYSIPNQSADLTLLTSLLKQYCCYYYHEVLISFGIWFLIRKCPLIISLQEQLVSFIFLMQTINFHSRRSMASLQKSQDSCSLPKMCSGSLPTVTLQGLVQAAQVAGKVELEKSPEGS